MKACDWLEVEAAPHSVKEIQEIMLGGHPQSTYAVNVPIFAAYIYKITLNFLKCVNIYNGGDSGTAYVLTWFDHPSPLYSPVRFWRDPLPYLRTYFMDGPLRW